MNTNIHRLVTGPFQINTWVIQIDSYALIIDPAASEFTGDKTKITSFLVQKNLTPLAFILTHGHFDHISGTGVLKSLWPSVPLICHKNDFLMSGKNAAQIQGETLCNIGMEDFAKAISDLPDADILIENECALSDLIKSQDSKITELLSDWKFIHTPGHTQGSICIYNAKEKLLFSGDTIFYHSYGRTDLEGGNQNQMIKTLTRLYKELPEDCQIFPGHEFYGFTLKENSL